MANRTLVRRCTRAGVIISLAAMVACVTVEPDLADSGIDLGSAIGEDSAAAGTFETARLALSETFAPMIDTTVFEGSSGYVAATTSRRLDGPALLARRGV